MAKNQYQLVTFFLNGKEVERMIDVRASLTDMLRNDFSMTSVKKGCEVGECGACNVLIDGECFNSCIYLAIWADGKEIKTVEGLLGPNGELSDIQQAFIKVGIGAEKKSRVISDKEKKITAFHEAGHAILFHVLPDVGPVYSVSIIPTGVGAAGYTMPLPEKDEMFNTKGKMLQDITVSLGGRVAEELIFDDITTGASQDIKQATAYAKSMVTKFGMSEALGLVSYGDDNDEVFIGRDFGHTSRGYGEQVATTIDSEVKRIIDECYDRAKTIIKEHEAVLYKCADLLLEKEKITREEFEALFEE